MEIPGRVSDQLTRVAPTAHPTDRPPGSGSPAGRQLSERRLSRAENPSGRGAGDENWGSAFSPSHPKPAGPVELGISPLRWGGREEGGLAVEEGA